MPSRRIMFIDALRGLAAFSVLTQHVADRLMVSHSTSEGWLKGIFIESFDFGRFGVAVFFIISGFVIPFSIRGKRAIYNFLISRCFRLYPAYWVSVLGAYVCFLIIKHYAIPPLSVLANATMFESALGVPVMLGPYWTLIIEIAFYFACVLFYVAGWLQSKFAVTLAFLVCLAMCWALTILGILRHHYYSANLLINLALMFYGLMIRRGDEASPGQLPIDVILGAIVLIVSIPIMLEIAPNRNAQLFTPLSFSCGYVLGILAFLTCYRWLTIRVSALMWLGSISYSLYLLHEIYLLAFEGMLKRGAGPIVQVGFIGLVLGFSLLSGWVVHRFVELPSIRIGKHIVASGVVA